MASVPELQQTDQYLAEVEGFRTMARLHGVPTGTPECIAALPLRLAQDWRLRGNFVELLRELQRKDPEFFLPDALTVLLRAVGGPTASPNRSRALDESVDLTAAFLASIGGWPGAEEAPITDLDHPSDQDPRLDPAYAAQDPDTREPLVDESEGRPAEGVESDPEVEAEPAEKEKGITLAEITQALARLERGSVDLRLHLDSIDQRLSRMEPLLEAPATSPATPPVVPDEHPPETARAITAVNAATISNPTPGPGTTDAAPPRDLVHRYDPPPAVPPTPTQNSDEPSASIAPDGAPSRPLTPRRDRFAAAMELPGTRSALHFPAWDEAQHFLAADSAETSAEAPELVTEKVIPDVSRTLSPEAQTKISGQQDASPEPAVSVAPSSPATPSMASPAAPLAPVIVPATVLAQAPAAKAPSSTAQSQPPAEKQPAPRPARLAHSTPPLADAPLGSAKPATPASAPATRLSPAAPKSAQSDEISGTPATRTPTLPSAEALPTPVSRAPSFSFGGMATPRSSPRKDVSPDAQPGASPAVSSSEEQETARTGRGPLVLGIVAALLIGLAAFLLLRGEPLSFLLDKPDKASQGVSTTAPTSTASPAAGAPNTDNNRQSAPTATSGPRNANPKAPRQGTPAPTASSTDRVLGARESMTPVVREQLLTTPTFVPEAVMKGRLLAAPAPLYPKLANAVGLAGGVIFEAIIGRDGAVEGLTVLGGQHLLRDAAANAVRQWRYQPFLLHGEPVEVRTIIHVNVTPPSSDEGTDTQ